MDKKIYGWIRTSLSPAIQKQKDVKWKSGEAQKRTFGKANILLKSARVLIFYDEMKELVLRCITIWCWSSRQTGRCLRTTYKCTITPAERNYSQLDKESLAMVVKVLSTTMDVFTSIEMKKKFFKNNIHHIHATPFHPLSNGMYERHVQTTET